MEKEKAVQNKIKLKDFQSKLKEIDKSYYYLFLIGFNLGLKLKKTIRLDKKEVENIIKERKNDIIRKNKLAQIKEFLECFDKNDYLFLDNEKNMSKNEINNESEKIYFILKKTAQDSGIDNFGNEILQRSFAYFHYQYFQDIDRIKDLLNLVSPTATLHYMGYEDDRYLCFYCNRGCIYRKKYK